MAYELWIGLKFLRAKRRHRAISLVTVLSVLGVSVGVTALIVVISVMSGFAESLKERILGFTAHVVVTGRKEEILQEVDLASRLMEVEGVVGATPFLVREVILQGPARAAGAVVRGLDPSTAARVLPLRKILKDADPEALAKPSGAGHPGIVLGKELMRYLGCGVGDHVVMVVPLGTPTPWGTLPKWKRFEVRGFFDSGYWEFDFRLGYVALSVAQEVFEVPGRLTGVELKLADLYRAPEVRRFINSSPLGRQYVAEDWMERNRSLLFALNIEKRVMFVILLCIVGVAGLLIISILVMMVMEKKKDVGILKAMGARAGEILRVFLFQGLIIGIMGTLLGSLGGLLISWNLDSILIALEKFTGLRIFPSEAYYLPEIPARVNALDVAVIVLATLGISLISAAYPSWRASKLDPVEALRYD
jgi:lipoprotein-releasing system permease protein